VQIGGQRHAFGLGGLDSAGKQLAPVGDVFDEPDAEAAVGRLRDGDAYPDRGAVPVQKAFLDTEGGFWPDASSAMSSLSRSRSSGWVISL
jgi:hypothetical protein